MRPFLPSVLPFAVAAVLLQLAGAAVAQDECAQAVPIGNGPNGPFHNVGATTSQPWTCGPAGADVWFRYVATCTGPATVDTCGAAFDTVLEVFLGSGGCGALQSVGCNDDACGLQSAVTFTATTGVPYYVRVGGYAQATGSFPLHVVCTSSAAPNDECFGAVAVPDGSSGPYGNVGATTSAPAWNGVAGGADVWFAYIASSCGNLTVDTCGAGFDTCVEVFAGTCTTLRRLGGNDDGCGTASSVTVPVAIGHRYYLRVGGKNGATGTFPLHLSCVAGPPPDDECAGALPIQLGTNGPYTNECATTSAPAWPCGSGGNDLWFVFTPTVTAPYTFRLCGSDFDTAIEVFGGGCGNLTSLACNDDWCGVQSSVTVNLQANVPCLVRAGGYIGSTGVLLLEALMGTGNGTITYRSAGCGPLALSLIGNPGIGSRLTAQLANVQGLPLVGLGFQPFPAQTVCGCILGHGWQALAFGASLWIDLPPDPTFLGAQFGVQGADLLGSGGCPSPAFALSDTQVVTIG